MVDLLIVLAFVAYSVTMGFVMRKRASRGPEEYFLAGRSLKGWQAGLSMAATQYAADTPLLVTGLVATAGIFSLWRLWVYALAFLFMGFVLGSSWRRARVLTDAELTELRYSGRGAAILRALKAIHLGTLVNCTVLAMVLLAATRIAEPFLVWHEWLPTFLFHPLLQMVKNFGWTLATLPLDHAEVWVRSTDNLISILAIVSFTTLYSTTGGLRSVVATDVVQFAVAMAATAIYAVIVVTKAGGVGGMMENLSELYGSRPSQSLLSFGPSEFGRATMIFLAVLAVQWFAQVNADGTGYLAQRTMACQTDRDTKIAGVTFTTAQIFFRSLIWLPIAVGLLVLYPADSLPRLGEAQESFRIAREGTFAQGIKDFLPVGIRGLMLTGMLAALASTVDTHLNWGASYWTNDLYKRFLSEKFLNRHPSNRELVWIARVSNLGILSIALFIMSQLSSIQAAWHLNLLFGSGLGVVLILRWLWYRINLWSEAAAVGLSLAVSPVLLMGFPELSEGERLLWMAAISTAGVLIVTLVTRPESNEVLRNFYERVQPAGFWGCVERKGGAGGNSSLERLGQGVSATALAALSLFLLLVGFGKILTGSAETIFPYVLIAAGLLLVPLWRRLGLKFQRIGLWAVVLGTTLLVPSYAIAKKDTRVQRSLYERLGREAGIQSIVENLLARSLTDPEVNFTREGTPRPWRMTPLSVDRLNQHLTQFLTQATGGPVTYEGRDLKSVHSEMAVTDREFDLFLELLQTSLGEFEVSPWDQQELLEIVERTRPEIVEVRSP